MSGWFTNAVALARVTVTVAWSVVLITLAISTRARYRALMRERGNHGHRQLVR